MCVFERLKIYCVAVIINFAFVFRLFLFCISSCAKEFCEDCIKKFKGVCAFLCISVKMIPFPPNEFELYNHHFRCVITRTVDVASNDVVSIPISIEIKPTLQEALTVSDIGISISIGEKRSRSIAIINIHCP